jgi:hypothetical protein
LNIITALIDKCSKVVTIPDMSRMIALLLLMAPFSIFPEPDPGPEPVDRYDYVLSLPAVTTVYDPALGDINCDADCTTVATGLLEDWMYESAGACDRDLLGATVHFPAINLSIKCVDRGGMIRPMYSEHYGQTVLYFDVLWHLEKIDGAIAGSPEWNYWLLNDWYVTWR